MPPKKPRRVVLGEGYLKMLEISSIAPTDGYWPISGLTRLYPQEGNMNPQPMKIYAEVVPVSRYNRRPRG